MAETVKKPPEEVLASLLSNGNAPNPLAQLDTAPWTPTYSRSPEQEAQSRADLEYGGQIRAIQEAAQQAAQQNQRSRSIEQGYGREIDPRLKNIYDALGSSMKQRRGETKQNYAQAVGNIGGFYDQAQQSNLNTNTDILNRMMGISERLGLGAAVPDSIGKLMENYQFEQNQLSQGKAGRTSNLEGLAAEIYGLDTRRIGAAAQEGAQARSQAQQQVLKTLSDLLFQNEQEQGAFRRETVGLEKDKATALAQLIAQITDQRSQDQISARGNALQEFTSRAGIAQSNRQLDEQRRQFDIQVQEGAKDRAAASARARGGGGSSGNPLNDMLKMLQIEQLQQKLGTRELKGQEALEAFYGKSNPYWTKAAGANAGVLAPVAGPLFREAMNKLIQQATALAQPRGANSSTGAKAQPGRDPYELALSLAPTLDFTRNKNQDAIRAALDAFYKGYVLRP